MVNELPKWIILLTVTIKLSIQDCPEETLENDINVTWPKSPESLNVTSTPTCYVNDTVISRNCNGTHWKPPIEELDPCFHTNYYLDYERICPPGFNTVSNTFSGSQYCYTVEKPSIWNSPCYHSGGATVITDLSMEEIDSLIASLKARYDSKYFWLPAQRHRILMPTLWTIPGPNYGTQIQPNNIININTSIWKKCALLDIENRTIISEACTQIYPSLCLFINDINYPAQCPEDYHALRFTENDGLCFGIEFFNESELNNYSSYKNECDKLMGDDKRYDNEVMRFSFHKIATKHSMRDDEWCLFAHEYHLNETTNHSLTENKIYINSVGTLSVQTDISNSSCVACMFDIVHVETEMLFEYSHIDEKIYLSIYHPAGLWKYESFDKGVQCFSNSYGPFSVVDIIDEPVLHIFERSNNSNSTFVEKIVYAIQITNLISGEYWCTGHTKNFSVISTEKIVVSPRGREIHVFSLVLKVFVNFEDDGQLSKDFGSKLVLNITKIFDVDNALFMDILEYNEPFLIIVIHLQVQIEKNCTNEGLNILNKYNSLKETAETVLPTYNYTLINISSSTHCLPTTSNDIYILDWDLTSIGQVTAPKQFCLQENGLPVQRHCLGSYVLGAFWGSVIGICNYNYKPSDKTAYLYNFSRGHVDQNDTDLFLTDGLNYVLDDVNFMIPADIYYLAMSLQQIRYLANENETSIEICEVEQMTWTMNRIMDLHPQYLNLAQTLNSTNIILDAVEGIIKIISWKNHETNHFFNVTGYQLSVEPSFMVQVSHPRNNNISGLALSTFSGTNTQFTKMHVQPLYLNTTVESVLAIKNLEVATWIPDRLLNALHGENNDTTPDHEFIDDITIIISVFHNDVVFQRIDHYNNSVNGRIISVSIPGHMSNLEYPVPLIFKENNDTNNENYCVFWDFQSDSFEEFNTGTWSKKGCYMVKKQNNLLVCECYHLTHFGHLISIYDAPSTPTEVYLKHIQNLNVISLVGCFLSILGIIGIWITALIFRGWRRKPGTKILLQLSFSIALSLIIFSFFNLGYTLVIEHDGEFIMPAIKKVCCLTLGIILHYSVLASFMWMLITGVLQYLRFVKVLGGIRPSRFMIKSSLTAWGIPCVPVAIVLFVDKDNYIPDLNKVGTGNAICYPRGILLLTCVTIPIIIILIINVLIFVRIIFAISRGLNGKTRKADINLIYAQMRLSIFLFFLLGLTWVFEIFSFSGNLMWSYLFCLSGTLQGFVLFIYFILCDPDTRNLWVTLMKPQFMTSLSKDSISDTSLTTL